MFTIITCSLGIVPKPWSSVDSCSHNFEYLRVEVLAVGRELIALLRPSRSAHMYPISFLIVRFITSRNTFFFNVCQGSETRSTGKNSTLSLRIIITWIVASLLLYYSAFIRKCYLNRQYSWKSSQYFIFHPWNEW